MHRPIKKGARRKYQTTSSATKSDLQRIENGSTAAATEAEAEKEKEMIGVARTGKAEADRLHRMTKKQMQTPQQQKRSLQWKDTMHSHKDTTTKRQWATTTEPKTRQKQYGDD